MKIKYLVPILLIVFIFSFMGCRTTAAETTAAAKTRIATAETATPETNTQPVQENGEYNIGDTGSAGGFIFYINPNYGTDGWKYLEAAPNDFSGNNNYEYAWDYRIPRDFVETGATETAVGTGMSNTQKIVGMLGKETYAAKLCSDLKQGGYSDWFLPSKDELNLMYENLSLKQIGSFESEYYWSSSEADASHAWSQNLDRGSGRQYGSDKYAPMRVRAVRAFS